MLLSLSKTKISKALICHPVGLRQDYASTSATASRRSSSFSLHSLRRSEMDLEEEDEEDEGYDQLPPPQPRLFRTGSMQRGSLPHSHTFSSMRDCKRTSTTPQFSLSGLSQYSGPSSLTTEIHTAYRNSTGERLMIFFFWSCETLTKYPPKEQRDYKGSEFFSEININVPIPKFLTR